MANCNVISHRGSNKIAPQNTLPAFRQSILYKADGFETDVHLSADGVPVICHNYEVDETSDGKGEISSILLEDLKEMDFGSYFHPSYKGTRIPTLEEFLLLCEKANLKILNIEIKPPKNHKYDVVEKTIEAVKAHGLYDELIISSFDPDALIAAKEFDETCKTAFLYAPNKYYTIKYFWAIVGFAKEIKVDALHPHKSYISKRYVDAAHEAGLMINPWTVNTERDIKYCLKCGVDSVITDVPNFARKVIDEYNK